MQVLSTKVLNNVSGGCISFPRPKPIPPIGGPFNPHPGPRWLRNL